jgi:hypothetical protein
MSDMDNLPLKRCSTCKEHKSLDNFSRDKSRKDGISWRCKSCHAEMNKKYIKTPEYREKQRIKANVRYHANKDELNAKARANRLSNLEEKRLYARNWRASRKKIVNEKQKQWRINNPDKVKDSNRRSKNRRRGAKIEHHTIKQALDLYGSSCHLCGQPIDLKAPRWTAVPGWELGLHLDHIIRISEGGKDCLDNVRPSHAICNLKRH